MQRRWFIISNSEENDDFDTEGVEFDLRTEERMIFARGYRKLNQYEAAMYGVPLKDQEINYFRRYISQVRALASMLMNYATDQEVINNAIRLKEHCYKELQNFERVNNYSPQGKVLDAYRETIEELRFNANFKMPEKQRIDPETAGVDQL